MHPFPRRILVAVVLAVGATQAWAAHNLVPEQGAIQIMMLRQKSVQEELKLTSDQVKAIHDFSNGQWKKAKLLADASAAEQDAKFDELSKENSKFVHDTLTGAQHRRLKEITLQTAGLMWILTPDIAGELKLTDDQKKQLEERQHDARREIEDLLYNTKPEDQAKRYQEYRDEVRGKLGKVLTDEQRARWKEMKGEPFKGEFNYGADKPAPPRK